MREIGATNHASRLKRVVQQSLRDCGLADAVAGPTPVLVAVSGGADSICLAHVVSSQAAALSLSPKIAHLNHHLRGEASDADAAFVETLARTLASACYIGHADVRAVADRRHQSIEVAAREERYRFLASVARKVSASAVLVGHHADDQAETLLLRLIRGTGTAGLAGMRLSTPMPYDDRDSPLRLLRPLLTVTRDEITSYNKEHDLVAREDATNYSTEHLRNKVRMELLPALTQYNPGIRKVLAHLADNAAEDQELLAGITEAAWLQCALSEPAHALSRRLWKLQLPGLQRALIRMGVAQVQHSVLDVRFNAIEEARAVLLGPASTAQISLNSHIVINLNRDVMTFALRAL